MKTIDDQFWEEMGIEMEMGADDQALILAVFFWANNDVLMARKFTERFIEHKPLQYEGDEDG